MLADINLAINQIGRLVDKITLLVRIHCFYLYFSDVVCSNVNNIIYTQNPDLLGANHESGQNGAGYTDADLDVHLLHRRPITGLANVFCQIPPPARKPDTQPSGRGVGRHPTMNTRVKMDHRAGFAPSLSGFADPHLIYSAIGG